MKEERVAVPVDTGKNITKDIIPPRKGAKDTKLLRVDLTKYEILNTQQHTFINTFLQLSNQILGLRQQYQQHIAAIDDITETIKELKMRKIRDIYVTKGGMFLVKKPVDKSLISNFRLNALNCTPSTSSDLVEISKTGEI